MFLLFEGFDDIAQLKISGLTAFDHLNDQLSFFQSVPVAVPIVGITY